MTPKEKEMLANELKLMPILGEYIQKGNWLKFWLLLTSDTTWIECSDGVERRPGNSYRLLFMTAFAEAGIDSQIKGIPDYWGERANYPERLIVPEGVTHIEIGAFVNCDNLEEVILPNSLDYIYEGVFSGCVKLRKIYIPSKFKDMEKEIRVGTPETMEIIWR